MNPLFRLTLVILPLFILKPAICQNITGQITNKEHKKIEFATINLYKDTSLIATTITDSTGGYIFNGIPDGVKRMQVSSIGYSNQEISFGNHRDTVVNLQLIEEKNLKEIVVNSKKKLIEKKGDRLVFNVENSIMASSMDAFTALQNTPGVIITENAIRLIGKGSVSLMIDEKINHLPTDALINFLKNLPASDIAKIEIITNPPAQYEAQGNYGLINIVMKKSVRLGYNGDVYAKYRQTAYPMYKTGTSFYYDKAKTKVNAGVNWGDGSYKQSITNTVNYPSQNWVSEEPQRQYNRQISGTFGVEQHLSRKSKISLDYNGFYQLPDLLQNTTLTILNSSNQIDSSLISNNKTKQRINNQSFNTQYTYFFDSIGRKKMIVTADYIYYTAKKNLPFSSTTKDANGTVISDPNERSLSNGIQSCNIGTLNTLFIFPIKNGELNYGAKFSFTGNKDDVSYSNWINDAWQIDSTQTNIFYYRENTQAAFASYRNSYKKWDYQIGVRGEYTQLKGGYDKTFSQLNTSYFKFFPTAYLSYRLNDDNSFSINYGKRIDRPAYFQLNPFRWLISKYTYVIGNSTLQPSYVHNFELSHNYKGVLNTSIFFSKEKEGITQLNIVDTEDYYQFITIKNAYNKDIIGLNVFYFLDKIKNIESSIQGSLTYQKSKMFVSGTIPQSEGWNYYFSINNQIYINKNKTILGSCNFSYNSSNVDNIYHYLSYSQFDVGLRFILFNKKVFLDVSGSDLFKTNIVKSTSLINGIAQSRSYDAGVRSLNIGVRYKFGNYKLRKNDKDSGAEDEKNRLK